MSASPSAPLADASPPPVQCALEAIYNWNYEPEIEELRTLYANALERQWIGFRDLDWEQEIDPAHALQDLADPQQFPVGLLHEWKRQPEEGKRRVALKRNAFFLSQFLHGEQGALMVAAQLVNAVPHMDGKFYASTQTLDEARHVEVFARYIQKLDRVYEIDPVLKGLLDEVLATDDWMKKCVGMQIVLEGLALASFRNMRRTTHEPLLRELLRRVTQDEARHTGYGLKYLNRVIPQLDDGERRELEDFAFETTRKLVDERQGGLGKEVLAIFASEGMDVAAGLKEMQERRDEIKEVLVRTRREQGFDATPMRGFVIPALQKLGLFNERTAPQYTQLVRENMMTGTDGTALDGSFELPDDLEAWVEETGA